MNSVVIERTINAPVARVWRALSDPQDLSVWMSFLKGFRAEVGCKVNFQLGKDEEHQYLHAVEVTEVVDDRKLSFTWSYPDYPGNSLVSFELFPDGERTRLTLTHTITEPFPADNDDFGTQSFAEGWNYTADGLKDYVETKVNKEE